jgi:serine/threonine protein kinase
VGGFSTIWLGKWADPNYGPPGQYVSLIQATVCVGTDRIFTMQLALKAFSGSRLPGQSEKFKAVSVVVIPSSRCDNVNLQRVRRETQNWHKMRHVNVLPLLGICNAPVDGIPDYPILVSHYCRQGNVNDYLRKYPQTPRGTIVCSRLTFSLVGN